MRNDSVTAGFNIKKPNCVVSVEDTKRTKKKKLRLENYSRI